MAGKAPLYGVVEISLHGAKRTRDDWMKGRENNEIAEIDFSAVSKDGRHMSMVIDFTANVIGLVYETTDGGDDQPVPEMLKPPVDWRATNPPRDAADVEHRRIWEAAQKKAGTQAP